MKKNAVILVMLVSILLSFALVTAVGICNDHKKYQNIAVVFEQDPSLAPSPLSGEGTKNKPYLIDSAEALCKFRDHVNSGYAYTFEYVRQTVDIDLSHVENWQPIGIADSGNYFEGYYDGAGHCLRNLTVYDPNGFVGLFGCLSGTVVNLGIESGSITGLCIGSIAAVSGVSESRIINCYNKASLHAYRAGGIADHFGGTIYNCANFGEIDAVMPGGIIGYSGRVVDSFSPDIPAASPEFTGILGESCKKYSGDGYNAEKVCSLLNRRLDGITVNYLQGEATYRWQIDEGTLSFGKKDVNLFPLRFFVVSLCLIALTGLAIVLYFTRSKEGQPATGSRTLRSRFAAFCETVTASDNAKFRFLVCGILQVFWCMILAGVLCGNQSLLYGFTFNNGRDLFMDFFNPLSTMYKGVFWFPHLYEADTYPPLANLIFFLLARFIPGDSPSPAAGLRTSFAGMIYFVFAFFCVFLLFQALRKKLGKEPLSYLLALSFALCSPILFNVERGNILLLSVMLTGLFLIGSHSESKVVRELSLIALAVAACIKIYPALFGLLLLHEKRYKEAARCVIYGLVLFFVPFAFFGGIPAIHSFLSNLTSFVGGNTAAPRDHLMSYTNLLSNLTQLFFRNAEVGRNIANITKIPLALLLAAIAVFGCRKTWKSVLMLSIIVVMFPDTNSYYALSFYLFPLAFFLVEKEHETFDLFYVVFLCLCVSPLQFLLGLCGINFGTLLQIYATIQLMLPLGLLIEAVLWGINKKKTCVSTQ